MSATKDERLTALFARTPTRELVKALRTLDALPPSQEHCWSRAKTIEEVERRFPQASAAVQAAFEAADQRMADGGDCEEVDYVAVLLAALPAEATRR